ncbi:MAG TPA: hypothetical protein VI391_06915, partial [Thermoanaerobaculia bacterium]
DNERRQVVLKRRDHTRNCKRGERPSRPQSAGVAPADQSDRARRALAAGETPALLSARSHAELSQMMIEMLVRQHRPLLRC